MSGFSDIINCPNCDEEMFISEESRPFHAVNGDCPHCGFYYHTQAEQMSLFELNDLREDHDLKPLKQRPIIESWLKGYLRPSFSENNLFRNAELTNKDTLGSNTKLIVFVLNNQKRMMVIFISMFTIQTTWNKVEIG